MGKTKPITVQFTGAPAKSFLAGTSDHNKGLLIEVSTAQERVGQRVVGSFVVLKAGRGRYAAYIRSFEGQKFETADEFINQVRANGAPKLTHVVNRNSMAVMDPDTSMSLADVLSSKAGDTEALSYDAFISHASEDKADLVRPLADALVKRGRRIWYDDFTLRIGDSLRRSIDKGLRMSRFGIVILSHSFFSKRWPQYELDGLISREMTSGKVVLPIWHGVTKSDVLDYSPSLVDKLALDSRGHSITELARILDEALG